MMHHHLSCIYIYTKPEDNYSCDLFSASSKSQNCNGILLCSFVSGFTGATVSAYPDPLQDFCVADLSSSRVFMNELPCINTNDATAHHFTTCVLNTPGNTSNSIGANVTAASPQVFPGINTLGLMIARLDLAVARFLPLHSHPRASEICFVLEGFLRVGFHDTTNKLFYADIKSGDAFVFPKALMHYIQNSGSTTASAILAFNSQAPGEVLPFPIREILNNELAKPFQSNFTEVDAMTKNAGGS